MFKDSLFSSLDGSFLQLSLNVLEIVAGRRWLFIIVIIVILSPRHFRSI